MDRTNRHVTSRGLRRRPPGRSRATRLIAALAAVAAVSAATGVAGAAPSAPPVPAVPYGSGKAPLVEASAGSSDAPRPALSAEQRAGVSGHERLGSATLGARSFGTQRYVVVAADEPALDAAVATIGRPPADVWRDALFGFVADLTPGEIDRLRATPGISSVEPDRQVSASVDQPNPTWGLDRIDQRNLPLNTRYVTPLTGAGVTAYIIDSGVWTAHSEFSGRIGQGAYYPGFGDGYGVEDCDGHGTHVAGTVGGTTYGVAKAVTIVPVRVLDCDGFGPIDAVIAGIDWVVDHHAAGAPAVANISLGLTNSLGTVAVDAAVNALIADGVTVAIAAGNDAQPTCNYSPAGVAAAITVAASTQLDDDADFSNYGPCNDIFAPGEAIVSAATGTTSGVTTMSGTSMASPHVAGAAALLLQVSPAASPAQIWTAIEAASTKGVLSECCNDPDKLLFVDPAGAAVIQPSITPLAPARILETRPGLTTVDAQFQGIGRRGAGSTLQLTVTNRAGVPGNAAAVMLNVTAVTPSGPGFLTVFPCGETQPVASSVNYSGGVVVPNAVLAKVGAGGTVCIYTLADTDILVDVGGYVPSGGSPVPMGPSRLLETRPGLPTVDGQSQGIGRRPAGSTTELQVAGRPGVPGDASAVILNVTAVTPSGLGYLTVFPCGETQPVASSVNYAPGAVVPNAVLAKVGTAGKVCIFTLAEADILVDVSGYVPAGGAPSPLVPARILETRVGLPTVDGQSASIGRRGAGSTTELVVTNRAGVPSGASAVMLNVTAVNPSGPGYLTVYPCGQSQPVASSVNYAPGAVVPNAVLAKVGTGGRVCIFTLAATDILVDVGGYV